MKRDEEDKLESNEKLGNQHQQHDEGININYNDCNENDQKIIDNFFEAIICKDIEKVKQYLDEYPKLIFCKDFQHFTPLHIGAMSNNHEIINLLIDRGANPNIPLKSDIIDGFTLLHYATAYGLLVSVITLLSRGANPETKNKEGESAWVIANRYEEKLIAFMLTPTNEDGYNPTDEILFNKYLTELAGEIEYPG